MEDKHSENEKLRKQIQFLTGVIENAKSRRQQETQCPSYHCISDNYIQHGQFSTSYRPRVQKASSYPYFSEWNTRPKAKTFNHERSHHIGFGPENSSTSQSKFKYDLKCANMQTSKNVNETEIKCGSSSRGIGLSYQSLKVMHNQCVTTNDLQVAQMKKSMTVTKPKSLTESTHVVTNSIELKSIKDSKVISSNSGNLSDNPMKSNSSLLQKEIEKMHNKIANLKKALQEKQSCKSATVAGKCGEKHDNQDRENIVLDSSTAKISSSENNDCQKTKNIVGGSCISVGKQQSLLSRSNKIPDTKSDGVFQKTEIKFSPEKSQEAGKRNSNFLVTHAQDVKFSKQSHEKQQSDLVSLSKYKLTRLAASPTKHSSSKTAASAAILPQCTVSNVKEKLNLDQKPVQTFVESQTNISLPAMKNCSSSTPAKFIRKSKYSIFRVKSSGKKGSTRKKLIRSQSKTPAKFLSFSKYAIKRVRRSLSDENEKMLPKNTDVLKPVNKSYKGSIYSLQPSVCVLRSKFKMEKVQSGSTVKRISSSEATPSYRLNHTLYQHRYCKPIPQRCHDRQYRWTNFGYYSYFKRGGYYSRFKGQGWPNYRHGSGRYGIHLPKHTYTRRQAVSERYLRRRLQRLRESVPFNPKHKLDRRKGAKDEKTPVNFIMINGMLYKSNAKTLVKAVSQKAAVAKSSTGVQQSKIKKLDTTNMKMVTVRGVKFRVDRDGKSLHELLEDKSDGSSTSKAGQISRVDIGGVTYVQTKPGTLERVGSLKSRMAATRVVNKTVQRAAAMYRKDNTKVLKKKKYCMFYNKFGKCNKKGSCPYIHDPEKVAVCTRFLRGTCNLEDCPFSHKVSKDKMPVCSYFLKGVCNRDKCPYLHVNVNRDAEICQEFVKGYCPQGEKCKKKHILKCPEFTQTGSCSKGDKCTLQHRRRKRKSQMLDQSAAENSKKQKLDQSTSSKVTSLSLEEECKLNLEVESNKQASDVDSDVNLPFKERKLPAYISLKTNTSEVKDDVIEILDDEQKHTEKNSKKIRPQL